MAFYEYVWKFKRLSDLHVSPRRCSLEVGVHTAVRAPFLSGATAGEQPVPREVTMRRDVAGRGTVERVFFFVRVSLDLRRNRTP